MESDLSMTISDGMIRQNGAPWNKPKMPNENARTASIALATETSDDLHRPEDTKVEYICHRRDGHEFETAHSNRCNYWKKRDES